MSNRASAITVQQQAASLNVTNYEANYQIMPFIWTYGCSMPDASEPKPEADKSATK
jgi:hypothetical protein